MWVKVRGFDLWFNSKPFRIYVTTFGKLITHWFLSHEEVESVTLTGLFTINHLVLAVITDLKYNLHS